MSVYPSYLVHKILLEAGLPPGVIQLVNGDPEMVTRTVFVHWEFSALSFIGCSSVFRSLYGKAAEGVVSNRYREFPRMVGETSGKNFHLVHRSADIENTARHTIRASIEYSGQKCSAYSRIYLPQSQATAFLDEMKHELSAVKVSPPENFETFLMPVINQAAFDKITRAIDSANKDSQLEKVIEAPTTGAKAFSLTPPFISPKHPTIHYLNKNSLVQRLWHTCILMPNSTTC